MQSRSGLRVTAPTGVQFRVNVPVLSEQITVVEPSASTAAIRRIFYPTAGDSVPAPSTSLAIIFIVSMKIKVFKAGSPIQGRVQRIN
jgi:hypothetical protein